MGDKTDKIFRLPVKLVQEGYMEISATSIEDVIGKFKDRKIKGMMHDMIGPDYHFIVPNSDGYYELNGNENDFIEAYNESVNFDQEWNIDNTKTYDFCNFYNDKKDDIQ